MTARQIHEPDLGAVDRAFSLKAAEYDAMADRHPIVIWMRDRIRAQVAANCPEGGRILELSAGSGLDAAYFASKGFRVHATDVAEGMLAATAAKAADPALDGRLTFERRSFTELESVEGGPYDLVFSNLGGLNCIEDLSGVGQQLPRVLRSCGTVVWVIMPPVCPWELAQALRGHVRTAKRRLQRDGDIATIEGGQQVHVWYHSVADASRALGARFEVTDVRSYCMFAPPSFFEGFVRRRPRLTRALMRIDDALGSRRPFNRAGDFYAITANYRG